MYEDLFIVVDKDPSTFENYLLDDSELPAAPESWKIEDFEDILSMVRR